MAISMQSRVAGMPIDMSGYESLLVGCKGPFAEVRKEMTICNRFSQLGYLRYLLVKTLTVCQNEKKITSLMHSTFKNGL